MVAYYPSQCIHAAQLGHPGPVRSESMTCRPPALPVFLVIAILHFVRSPRHLPPTARPPKASLCRAVDRRLHWRLPRMNPRKEFRQGNCGPPGPSGLPNPFNPEHVLTRIYPPLQQCSVRNLGWAAQPEKASLTRISRFSAYTPHGIRVFCCGVNAPRLSSSAFAFACPRVVATRAKSTTPCTVAPPGKSV